VPVSAHAFLREFYVYRLEANGVPFYVGIGRSARASDRVRYVRYLMAREAQGKPTKWCLSYRVVAGLLRADCNVQVAYAATGMTRAEALIAETNEITRLVAEGFALANIQQNPNRPKAPDAVVSAVLERLACLKAPATN
jgi:hypothetical protein